MSTRIHSGYRLPGQTLDTVMTRIDGFRESFFAMRRAASAATLATHATRLIDDAAATVLTGEPPPRGADRPLSASLGDLVDRAHRIDREGLRDPEADFGLEIVLLRSAGDVLLLVNTERTAWEEAAMSELVAEPFGYWDNTDPPEDIEARDWDARRRLWNDALSADPHARPAFAGLTARLSETRIEAVPASAVALHVPTLDDRVMRTARTIARARILARHALSDVPTSRIFRALAEADREMESPEGRQALDALARDLRPLLPEIDADRLAGGS